MDIYSLFLGYKRKVLPSDKVLSLSSCNMDYLIALILGSSMTKIRLQDLCLPTKDMMFGLAIAEVISILETIPNTTQTKEKSFGNLLSNTWLITTFQLYSLMSTK